MIALTCWLRRALGLVLAATLLTGNAHAQPEQPGRAEIAGRVVAARPGEEGPRGLPGATVELRGPRGERLAGAPFATPITGAEGKFSFVEVPEGEYLLYVFAAGYAPHQAKLYCTAGSVTQLSVRLEQSVAGKAPGQKKTPRDPLPGAAKLVWDVRVLEESPLFDLVRREVKGRKVTWLLENSETNLQVISGYRADFIDVDGVRVASVEFKCDPTFANWRAGERNRLILDLPQTEELGKAVRVVIARLLS